MANYLERVRLAARAPIAYTWHADHACPTCAESLFASDLDAIDPEGHNPGVIYSWDEWHECNIGPSHGDDCRDVLGCGYCHEVIDRCGSITR